MRHNLVENCMEYDIGEDISDSTFLCKRCTNNYYLKDYECHKRDVTPPNCTEFEITDNKCKACSSGNFLSTDGTQCIPQPQGIINCQTYSNFNNCSNCKQNTYLSNNECLEVPIDVIVEFCSTYSSSTQCQNCNSGYFLNSNQCITANAQNCETYTSVDNCATCKEGYGLKTENGKTNCISVNKANCLEFKPSGNFECLKCNTNYYPNADGECQIVNPIIPGCVSYSSNT